MKGLSEVFLLVWVSGHQCQKWKRESGTDAKGVTGGASVSFVMDGFGVRGKVEPLTATENAGGEAGRRWRKPILTCPIWGIYGETKVQNRLPNLTAAWLTNPS